MGIVEVLALSLMFVYSVNGDCYMHNGGSNNRLKNEARDRRNANRLFDSQNNARGGYNVGRGMEYYVGSTYRIEWTNQHSCGEQNNNCELVVQYMCDDRLRDGSEETTIPDDKKNCYKKDCNNDLRFGMHEDFEYYETCRYTQANGGLFAADENPGPTARRTRQDDKGTRYGYECPEERDYYPYWRPTPWRDVVVFTNDMSRCAYYEAESENVKSRFYCKPPAGYLDYLKTRGDNNRYEKYIPITQVECEKLTNSVGEPGEWLESPSHGIPKPDCVQSPRNRDNHHGNTIGGEKNFYEWKIPDYVQQHCTLRMRYNISTNDFDTWKVGVNDNKAPIHNIVDLPETTAEENGFYLKNDPVISPITVRKDGQNVAKHFQLQLNVDTSQYGRTFEDRTHAWTIMPRPASVLPTDEIRNIGVRGKRGNIVQTYPAVEYDFYPNNVTVQCDKTWIHFQWTGADTNNGNNAGQGRARTDRSNICQLGKNNYPKNGDTTVENKYGHYASSYPIDLRQGENFLGLSDEQERMLCFTSPYRLDLGGFINGANSELDDAGVYFNMRDHFPQDGGLVKCRCDTKTVGGVRIKVRGVWYYLSTRNNNFTNRSQKAMIICE